MTPRQNSGMVLLLVASTLAYLSGRHAGLTFDVAFGIALALWAFGGAIIVAVGR